MATLDEPADRPDSSADDPTTETTATVDGTELTVSVPADASPAQAAAIVSAVGAHVTDQRRVAAAAEAEAESIEYRDRWTLAARIGRFGTRRLPTDVERGEEWKAAARAQY